MTSYLVVGRHAVYVETHLDDVLDIYLCNAPCKERFKDPMVAVQRTYGLKPQALQMASIGIMPPALAGNAAEFHIPPATVRKDITALQASPPHIFLLIIHDAKMANRTGNGIMEPMKPIVKGTMFIFLMLRRLVHP